MNKSFAFVKQESTAQILEEVRRVLRVHHYSTLTERFYADWAVKLVRFHYLHSREDHFLPEPKSEAFLIHLEVNKNLAPTTGQCFGITAASQSSALQ